MYHKIDHRFEWGINTVNPTNFEKQIKYLADNQYKAISLTEYLKEFHRTSSDKFVVITFDDSYKSVFEFAYPILKKYHFKASIFVITGFVGGKNSWDVNIGGLTFLHLSWEELRRLADDGWEIGSHTVTHPDLRKLSNTELIEELGVSKHEIEQKLNTKVHFLSYPFGRFNERVLRVTKEVGYRGACTSLPQRKINYFTIPRRGVYRTDTLFNFKWKLKSDHWAALEDLKQTLISFFSCGTILWNNVKKTKKYLLFFINIIIVYIS